MSEALYKWHCHECGKDGFVSVSRGASLWAHIIDAHRELYPECSGESLSQQPLRTFPGAANYRCFNCHAIIDGDLARWLCDDADHGYPFCSLSCIDQPWPLSEASNGQHLQLWSDAALVITMATKPH